MEWACRGQERREGSCSIEPVESGQLGGSMDLEVTKEVLAALEREGVRYVVFNWGDAEALRRRFNLEDD